MSWHSTAVAKAHAVPGAVEWKMGVRPPATLDDVK